MSIDFGLERIPRKEASKSFLDSEEWEQVSEHVHRIGWKATHEMVNAMLKDAGRHTFTLRGMQNAWYWHKYRGRRRRHAAS